MANALQRLQQAIKDRVDPELIRRIDDIPRENIGEFGTDAFGFDPEVVKLVAPVANWFYRRYFRVNARGLEHLPEGRFLLISNHSGQLPFDGFMIGTACLAEAPRPRIIRSMVERWSAELPFVSHFFVRAGQVVGDPATCRRLLENDEAVLVFPEGARGISKLFAQRYQLESFGTGFMRLALETGSPIVPVAVVGAEEQAPAIYDIKPLAKLLGFPAAPIIFPQLVPLPLPVRYHITFGPPMTFEGTGDDDDEIVGEYVKKVRNTIQRMLQAGLEQRQGLF
jgi:1-acyl-sn-glycerol-3-phosphate acyltransferase